MTESHHNSLLLKKSNEAKLNGLITSFGKAEPNHLRFSELLYMLLDRCIFINRLSFRKFVQIFESASKIVSKTQKKDSQPPADQSERALSREQFVHFMGELGHFLYREDKHYLERIFEDLLTQKVEANSDNDLSQPRVLTLDDTNRKLLVESCVVTLASYQPDIRALFNTYLTENYLSIKNQKRLLLTEREIDLQNKKLNTNSFVTFLKEAEICPHMIGIDHVEDIMKLIIPHADMKESEYYHKHCLVDAYTNTEISEDKWKHVSDPGIMSFEFVLILARIGWDTYPKDIDKKGIEAVMDRFFGKALSLRSEQNRHSEVVAYKKHLAKLKEYDEKYSKTSEVLTIKSSPPQPPKDMRLVMAEKHEAEVTNMPQAMVDVVEILKVLEKELPKLPPKPVVRQQNPPPFKDQKIIIGQVPPPEEKEDDKGKGGGDAKKDAGKKDEEPARVFPWAKPPVYVKSSEDYLQELATKLSYEVQPLSSLGRGTINRSPLPCLISETLYPPEIPKEVEPFIIAGRTCTIEKNYFLALENYNKAHATWKQFAKRKSEDLPDNAELYFQYTRGSLCCSAGKDDHALSYFFNCRKHIEGGKLGFVNPDRALPFFGIGQVLYEVGEYQFSARAFLKAREIRESVLGIEHVQTATVFNNLGACYFMLERATEALGYMQIAEAVFSAELGTKTLNIGPYHERTMTARSNLAKLNKGEFNNIPQYRKLWECYEKDEYQGGKKKKKAGGKKK